MELRYKYRFNFFIFLNDIAFLTLSFVLSIVLIKYIYNKRFILQDTWMLPLLIAGWYFSSRTTKADDDWNNKSVLVSLYKTANSIFIQFFLVILFFFTSKQNDYSKRFLIFYIILLSLFIPLGKIFQKKVMGFFYKKPRNNRRLLVIGAGKVGMEFADVISKQQPGYEVIGFLDDAEKPGLNGQYLGKVSDLETLISDDHISIDEVLVALPNSANQKINHIANIVNRHPVKLRIIPAYHELINSQYSISIFNGFPMITNRYVPLDDINLRWVKRLFDIIFSLLVFILVFPWLIPIVAIAIKLSSKGPVFYLQDRWGKKNKQIKCYKFRTMYVRDAEESNAAFKQASKNDPRITRVGAFLRRNNIDEFPQFINVFFGEMSVVGPRPHPIPLNLQSKEVIDNYLVRHLVKPGITGWAQVNGFRGETPDPALMRARVKYDIWYIENWSLLLDIKIIFLTFWKTIAGDKNAF
ncbi:MAG TPA: undecaprenyl-phosphate glucose phosphotransferase [Parafilimonas sp.]|nr:undecaprenyl-phosphate glucose phosphotransferase [Parafilimonas sp.]